MKCKTFKFSWCLVYVFFLVCAFGVISKKSLPNPRAWNFMSMLSSKKEYILHASLAFRSLIYFELIFLYSMRQGFKFIHPVVSQPINCFSVSIKIHLTANVRIYFWMLILFHWPICLAQCQCHTAWIIVSFEIREWEFFNFVLFHFICFDFNF